MSYDQDAATARDGASEGRPRRRKTRDVGGKNVLPEISPEQTVMPGTVSADVADALEGLSVEERAVVERRFLHGRELGEIACELGISEWMVRRRLQVAVSRLRLDSLHQ